MLNKLKEFFCKKSAEQKKIHVNCKNLHSACDAVPRPHCRIGNSCQGDCPIYLELSLHCSLREPKFIPLSQSEIMAKVEDIECEKQYKDRCLKAGLCPVCGHKLEDISDMEKEFTDLRCPICNQDYYL